MITHTIESYCIPSQKKTKSKLQSLRIRQSFIFLILKQALHATHLLKLLDKMCKYEMYPTSIVEDTERTRLCPQTDRRTRWNQCSPFSNALMRGYNYAHVWSFQNMVPLSTSLALCEVTSDRWFPSQRVSNTESVSTPGSHNHIMRHASYTELRVAFPYL